MCKCRLLKSALFVSLIDLFLDTKYGDVMKPVEEAYWNQFKEEHNLPNAVFGSAWAFGASQSQADELARLTLAGEKRRQLVHMSCITRRGADSNG